MNKTLITFLAVIVVGIAIVTLAASFRGSTTTEQVTTSDFSETVQYLCSDNKRLTADFGEALARVTLSDSTAYTLEQTPHESGLRYANDGNAVVFVVRENVTSVEEHGVITHQDCVETEESALITARGTVTDINLEQAAYDGPILITITTKEDVRIVIAIPSMGLALCEAYKNNAISDPYKLVSGDEIEVAGARSESGALIPCSSNAHYLRVLSSSN